MLWMVRHGESEANAGAVTSDFAAIALTDRGRRQAEAVARACPAAPDWIGVSPYLRAGQTAAPLRARFPGTSCVEIPIHEFTYLSPRRCESTDARARQPMADAYWERLDPEHCEGDGAETFVDLCGRAAGFLEIAASRPGFGIVFTHEQFIRAVLQAAWHPGEGPTVSLMRRFLGLRTGLPIPNAAIVRLMRVEGRWWTGGVDVGHLEEV